MVRKIVNLFALLFTLGVLALAIWNFDVVLRMAAAWQSGTLTEEKIRYELAAYNFGKQPLVQPVKQKISPVDGMVQLYVPAGGFPMGNPYSDGSSSPVHGVYLKAFWIDRVEVSNAMYLKCIKAGKCTPLVSDNIYYKNWIYRDHPVVYVTWQQARTYCKWARRDLPTEAQWEKAARGTDGRLYPWGEQKPNPSLANFAGSLIHQSVSVYRYPLGASPYGALNMSGNAREWVLDWYDPNYYSISPVKNPRGPKQGTERSLRSGSYNEDALEIMATRRYKHQPQSAGLSRGFRCAEN